ncbi:MAG: hypothetical protein R3F49_19545 [Planctomycetota bacterium]
MRAPSSILHPRLSAAPAARRGGVPGWVPLVILIAGLFLVLRSLEQDARARGVARIDVTRYALHENTRYVHPTWRADLERVLRRQAELSVDDTLGIEQLVAEVRALPFVAEVGEPNVVWPDGLSLPLRMHEPVACIRVGGRDFLPVSADGTVLSGYTSEPHSAYGAWLPALGPHGLGEDTRGPYQPGDHLVERPLLDALDVARSMWFHLSPEEVRALGPIVIDASRETAPTQRALPGGVVIDMERARRILFGRPPRPVEPGELPVASKWEHVREGLARLYAGGTGASGGGAWDVLDVRFDQLYAASKADWAAAGEGER